MWDQKPKYLQHLDKSEMDAISYLILDQATSFKKSGILQSSKGSFLLASALKHYIWNISFIIFYSSHYPWNLNVYLFIYSD